jgi:hypothetical protein
VGGRKVVRPAGQAAKVEGHAQVGMKAVHIRGSRALRLCGAMFQSVVTETTYLPPGLKYGSKMCTATTRRERITGGTVEVSPPRVVSIGSDRSSRSPALPESMMAMMLEVDAQLSDVATLRLTAVRAILAPAATGCYKVLSLFGLPVPSPVPFVTCTPQIMTDFEVQWAQKWAQCFRTSAVP